MNPLFANTTIAGNSLLLNDSILNLGLLFCGALGFLVFLVILIYLKTRERIYLYYLLFISFSLAEAFLFIRHKFYMGNDLLISTQSSMAFIELFTLFAFSFYCLFSIQLLDLKDSHKKLYSWVRILSFASIFYAILYFIIGPFQAEVKLIAFLVSRLVIFGMSLVAIVWIIKEVKSPLKPLFIVGSCFYFLGAIVAVIRLAYPGIPSYFFYTIDAESYFQMGIFLEIISFTVALIYREYFYYEERKQGFLETNALAVYEKEVAQAEALALRIQINPHFLFNYLNVLKYYIQINENKKAVKYLTKFSQLIRNILSFSEASVISLEDELRITEQYLTLEGIRFDKNIKYDIKIDDDADVSGIMIPPMLLQPFIEEVLWRGRQDVESLSQHISVGIHQNNSEISIHIEEKGLFKNGKLKSYEREINREITSERIKLYNKNYDKKISYHIMDEKELAKTGRRSYVLVKIS